MILEKQQNFPLADILLRRQTFPTIYNLYKKGEVLWLRKVT
jgi:hypothetical protein